MRAHLRTDATLSTAAALHRLRWLYDVSVPRGKAASSTALGMQTAASAFPAVASTTPATAEASGLLWTRLPSPNSVAASAPCVLGCDASKRVVRSTK